MYPNIINLRDFVASAVTPAQAGVQDHVERLDSRIRGNDAKEDLIIGEKLTVNGILVRFAHQRK